MDLLSTKKSSQMSYKTIKTLTTWQPFLFKGNFIYLYSTIEINGCLHERILMNQVKLSQIKYLKVCLWYFVYLTEHFMYHLNETK